MSPIRTSSSCRASALSATSDRRSGVQPGSLVGRHGARGAQPARGTLGALAGPRHLAPAVRFTPASEAAPNEGYRTEFRIVGAKDGWFLIQAATPPGKPYVDDGEYPKRSSRAFAGRSFVPAGMVGAQYANGGTRMGGLSPSRAKTHPGWRRITRQAIRYRSTAAPSAFWAAQDPGRTWKAMTYAAGGAACARTNRPTAARRRLPPTPPGRHPPRPP